MSNNMQKYTEYKDSGVEWLGEVEKDCILELEKQSDGLIREILSL